MKYDVKFEIDEDDAAEIGADNLALLNVTPEIVSQDGNQTVARFDFPDDVSEGQIAAALDDGAQCAWCNTGWGPAVDDRPEM